MPLDILMIQSNDKARPTRPLARIFLNEYTISSDPGSQGKILIGPDCMTLREVEETIDRLQSDLEDIRHRAKVFFGG